VMYRGEIVAIRDGPTAEKEEIGLLMATGRRDAAAAVTAAPGPDVSASAGPAA
jgi:hypothetical protein